MRKVKPGELRPECDDYGNSKNIYVCDRCYDQPNPGPMAQKQLRYDDPRPKGRPRPQINVGGPGGWDPVGNLPETRVLLGTYFGGI
jgi:hypothetical protein